MMWTSRLIVLAFVILMLLSAKPFFASKLVEKHIIVLDAGSTGSRVYIYKYDTEFPLETISEVAHMRVNPALSTFVNNSAGLTVQLNSLVKFAMTITPAVSWPTIDISLKATAGLRSLNLVDQKYLIDATVAVFENSVFFCDPLNTRVLSGQEEALFDVLAVTALFQSYKEGFVSLGAADMGGSSQQIAFLFNSSVSKIEKNIGLKDGSDSILEVEIDSSGANPLLDTQEVLSSASSLDCSSDWRIGIPGRDEKIEIYAKSMPYMGLIAAMDTVLDNFYANKSTSCLDYTSTHADRSLGEMMIEVDLDPQHFDTTDDATSLLAALDVSDSDRGSKMVSMETSNCHVPLHPCLPDGVFPEVPGFSGHPQPLYGLGDFEKCHQLLKQVLVRQAQLTIDLKCLKMHRPKVMVGMDNYPKVLEILGIPQSISVPPSEIRRRATDVCRRSWTDLLAEYPGFMPYRAQRACFGATYVYSMLVDVYGIEEDDKEAFLPIDSVGEHELSWALGAAVFSAMDLKV